MESYFAAYGAIFMFLLLAFIVGLALLVVPFLVAPKKPSTHKLSAYECGFDAFAPARFKFSVKFYLVAIFFIIFDLEVALLVPWSLDFYNLSSIGFWSGLLFLFILTLGFVYEWKKGALEWE